MLLCDFSKNAISLCLLQLNLCEVNTTGYVL